MSEQKTFNEWLCCLKSKTQQEWFDDIKKQELEKKSIKLKDMLDSIFDRHIFELRHPHNYNKTEFKEDGTIIQYHE